MKRFVAILKRISAFVLAPFRWLWALIKWVFLQIRRLVVGLVEPVWERLKAMLKALQRALERLVSVLLDYWRRLWAPMRRGKGPREQRVGANAAPLLATLTLAATWYWLPVARVLEYGPPRFIFFGFLLWVVYLVAWLSRCREDRQGRVARFAQGVSRSTGLRVVDVLSLLLALFLGYLVLREIQLLPLALTSVISLLALLVVEERERPSLAAPVGPAWPRISNDDEGTDGEDAPEPLVPSGQWHRRELEWTVTAHGGPHRHHASVRIDSAAVEQARADNPGQAGDQRFADWVKHGTGPEVVDLARQIHDICFSGCYSLYATVSCYVAACQSIPYRSDEASTGQVEYWRYPIETLADGEGDCEDSAVLLAALLRRAGFRVVLILTPGHAAVGVEVPSDIPGAYFEHEGVRYYYCETTEDGWLVGVMPPEVEADDVTLVPIPPWEDPS